eukprot:Transcript_25258.p2 GENE.Transcript_25258~~Transcript_25258.p2  ORF type:complete len:256 (+),score=87.93 Transcript_25258:1116-1883(+)
MIGSALAVVHGVVPPDAVELGLASNLQVNVSPLAPGCGLLLHRVHWYDMATARMDCEPTAPQRAAMDAFKRDVLYPHVHGLYQRADGESELGRFLQLLDPTSEHYNPFHSPADYGKLRRMVARWKGEMAEKAAARARGRERAWEDAAADDDDDDRHSGDSVIEEPTPLRPSQPDRRVRRGLPGGLHVRICVHRGLVPGPELRAMVDRLREEVGTGRLQTRQSHEYYLARLDELYGAPAPVEVQWGEDRDGAVGED